MSSKTNKIRMQVVLETLDEDKVPLVEEELKRIDPTLSFSPCRPAPSLNDCLEFYATGEVTQADKDAFLQAINDDWTEDDGVYWAYGYNTTFFDPLVYYIQIDF